MQLRSYIIRRHMAIERTLYAVAQQVAADDRVRVVVFTGN
jgi:hypothetical protein